MQWLCCITRWTLDSVWRLQGRLSMLWGRLKSHTVSTWRGKGGERPRMLQWSCPPMWLMSHCIPTCLYISLRGDSSAQFALSVWLFCKSIWFITQFCPQPTVIFFYYASIDFYNLPLRSYIKKACLHGLYIIYKCISHILWILSSDPSISLSLEKISQILCFCFLSGDTIWLYLYWEQGFYQPWALSFHVIQTGFSVAKHGQIICLTVYDNSESVEGDSAEVARCTSQEVWG